MIDVTFNGVTYSIPTTGEQEYGDTLGAFLQALAGAAPAVTAALKSQASPAILQFGNLSSAGSDTAGVYMQPGFLNTFPGSTVVAIAVPCAGKLSNLRVHCASTWSSTAGQGNFLIYVNGVDAHLGCILQHGQQDASNTSGSVTVAAGDLVAVRLDPTGGTNAAMSYPMVTFQLTTT